MAEKLRGTGRVFATDMNPRFVDYIAQQARQRGLSNLEAVLVKGNQVQDGLDGFYARHRYDLILLYDIVAYIVNRPDFYCRLGGLLTPQGRMVVVCPETLFFPFFRDDFQDWEGFIAELKREPMGTPFGWNLRRPLRALLDGHPGGDARRLERAVLFHLNRLLELPFFMHFVDGMELRKDLAFTLEEKPYVEWLFNRVSLAGLPGERVFAAMPLREFRCVQRLNKFLITQRFRPYLLQQGACPYESIAEESGWSREEDVVKWELEAAGFKKKHDILPCQGVWMFSSCGTQETVRCNVSRPHPFFPLPRIGPASRGTGTHV